MLIEDINSMIEEHETSGSIEQDKWPGITNNQIVLLNASPVPLTYSVVVTLLNLHTDPFAVESPKVENQQIISTDFSQISNMNPQNLPFRAMQNPMIMNQKIIGLEEKLDTILAIISEISATLQVDQPPAEQ